MTEADVLPVETTNCELVSSRLFSAPRELVFRAFMDPAHLRHWWGPKGFTNRFQEFDPRPGGVWRFVMRGPDGKEYPNKHIFAEIVKPERIVLKHLTEPHFQLTITLAEEGLKTKIEWRMLFESPEVCARVKTYAAEANEQNFDRLAAELDKMSPLVITQTFIAPTDKVWKALTDLAQMKQWYFDSIESFKPELGFQTQFNVQCGEKNYLHQWIVTEVAPMKKLSYVWKYPDYTGESCVTFELFAENQRTKLRLTHHGLASFPRDNPDFARESIMEGWSFLIGKRLGEYLQPPAVSSVRPFIITRTFDAPRDLVWKAWTDREHLQWWGHKGVTIRYSKLELRPGGVFHHCMHTSEGHDMWGKWVIREIHPPERLVFVDSFSNEAEGITRLPMSATWPLEILSTITFKERDGQTQLSVQWLPISATDIELKTFDENHESMKGGWTGTFDRLDDFLKNCLSQKAEST